MRFRDELWLLPAGVWWLLVVCLLATAPYWLSGR